MSEPAWVLDDLVPRPDASERHDMLIHARPEVTLEAFQQLTLREMPLAAVLFGIRSLPGRLAGHRRLPSALDVPVLGQFTKLGFTVLAHHPGQEIVVGVIAQMWKRHGQTVRPRDADHFVAFQEPGFVKAAMSFRVAAQDGATRAVTETRVLATDPAARRGFGRYWLLVRPFSGVIRRDWLRAVAARAEQVENPTLDGSPHRRRYGRVLQISASTTVRAPKETVWSVYADYHGWPAMFPTIKAVRLLRSHGPTLLLEVDHREGKVLNELTVPGPDEIDLRETKRRYDARFVNRFRTVAAGTLFTVDGEIRLYGVARLLRPVLRGYVRRRMELYQLRPVQAAAEALSGTGPAS
jgi:hypothetical protein